MICQISLYDINCSILSNVKLEWIYILSIDVLCE